MSDLEIQFDVDEQKVINHLKNGMTYPDFSDIFGLSRYKTRKLIALLEDKGYNITIKREDVGKYSHSKVKTFYIDEEETEDTEDEVETDVNYSEVKRLTSSSKAAITRKVGEHLAKIEKEVKKVSSELREERREAPKTGELDVVFHRSDDHFGQVVTDEQGNDIYTTDTTEERIHQYFTDALNKVEEKRELGYDVGTAHLLLGGDIVTNESIYDGQLAEIDEFLPQQMIRASTTYIAEITRLAEEFDHVQVVCQAGNHGEFRTKKASSHRANADDIIYNYLEILCVERGLYNVSFVKSDRSDHVNFKIRDYIGHLRHGQGVRPHIGTSSPQSDWLAYKAQYNFDIAYRGHYHRPKLEPLSDGTPVLMAPTCVPPGDFAGSIGEFGKPRGYVQFVSDENLLESLEYINFDG